jgi:hypothetical protein
MAPFQLHMVTQVLDPSTKLTCFSSSSRAGNGKAVCKQMLETTLGKYYGVISKDAVDKAPGQHPPSKGAATGYFAKLQGKCRNGWP